MLQKIRKIIPGFSTHSSSPESLSDSEDEVSRFLDFFLLDFFLCFSF